MIIAAWLVTAAIMVAIFMFSAEVAEKSSKTGEDFTYKAFSISPSFRKLPEPRKIVIVDKAQFSVRKAAHFSIYTLLGISLSFSLMLTLKKRKLLWLFTQLSCMLYAVSDEFHQLFVPGRSCELRDVIIDSLGTALGIALFYLINFLLKKVSKRVLPF